MDIDFYARFRDFLSNRIIRHGGPARGNITLQLSMPIGGRLHDKFGIFFAFSGLTPPYLPQTMASSF